MSRDPGGRTRAVLFDYGLTLVTFSFPEACLSGVLERFRPEMVRATGGPAPSSADLLKHVLLPLEDSLATFTETEVDYLQVFGDAWRQAGLHLPPDLLYRILDAEQRCWESSVRVAPTAFETLRRVRATGVRTGICSNAPFPPEMMHRQVRGNGLGELMDTVVFSSEVGRRKPAPELFEEALRRLELAPAQALYVGDRVVEDYEGAGRVGMRAVISTELTGADPPAGVPTIRSLSELDEWL